MDAIEVIARAMCEDADEDPDATYAKGLPPLWTYRLKRAEHIWGRLKWTLTEPSRPRSDY